MATPARKAEQPTSRAYLQHTPLPLSKGTPFVKQYLADKLRAAQDRIADLEERLATAEHATQLQQGSFDPEAREAVASTQPGVSDMKAYIHDLEVDNLLLRESLHSLRRKLTQQVHAGKGGCPSCSPTVRSRARRLLLDALSAKQGPASPGKGSSSPRAVSPIVAARCSTGQRSPPLLPAAPPLIITSSREPPQICAEQPRARITATSLSLSPHARSAVTPGIFFRSLGRGVRAATVCQADDRRSLETALEATTAPSTTMLVAQSAQDDAVSGLRLGFIDTAFQAVKRGNFPVLSDALGRGLDVDVCSRNGTPLLVAAAAVGNEAAVALLLAEGADPTATDGSGHGPLTAAMHARKYGTAQHLLQAGVQW